MNILKDLVFRSYRTASIIALMVAAVLMLSTSCSDDADHDDTQYGYVQFKIYKKASYEEKASATRNSTLDLLSDAQKVKVVMQYSGSTFTQTLVLNAYNDSNAEFGMRSEKLQLLSGEYTIVGFYLYDKLDEQILSEAAGDDNTFTVQGGGLIVKDLAVESAPRGMASFKLVKEFVKTRAEDNAYPFNNIRVVDLSVKNLFTQEVITIKKIKVNYQTGFQDGSTDESLYPGKNGQTSYATCDTVAWLKAGNYQLSSYTTYSDKNGKNVLEIKSLSNSETFRVEDNKETKDVEVPIQLKETDEYIKDYIALKEIWEALDGPNWKYYGESSPMGSNWNFNKDIDMWGDQPGVALESDGRVASLNISGFGAKGVVPDAIGQLTQLKVLAFGTHDEKLGGHLLDDFRTSVTEEKLNKARYSYYNTFLKRDGREGLSEILRDAINRDDSQKPIIMSNPQNRDIQFGNITNQIKGISKAMMRLTGLQQFYIANSPITADQFFRDIKPDSPFYAERDDLSWSNLTNLLDIEIYNCPQLTALPIEFITQASELQSLNIATNKSISGEQLKSDWEAIADGPSGDKIQLIYMGFNNLKEFPSYDHLKKMTKLGLLDCTDNQIEKLHPFGKDVALVQFFLDNNRITEIPKADDGYFFGYNDTESFSVSGNKLTVFPDIFNAKSKYVMGSVDFSDNQIESFEGGDNFRGVNASTVNLSNNRLSTFPEPLFKSGSPISSLMLTANGIKEIPKGSMTGPNSHMLTSIDLTYNKLTSLPSDFYGTNIPYLYGIDVSYNSFSKFPYEPLDASSLTVFGIRHQRDEQGNRTLREWPTGIYQHASMGALYIGSNDLRKIDDTISPYIRILEIKDNPNISIDVSSVCPYITAGVYLLIYDKTQDIRGCSALGIVNN